MSDYVVLYEQDPESGGWGAYLPDLPGVVALGGSREEVETRILEAVDAALEYDREQGDEVPPPAHAAGVIRIEAGAVVVA